MSSSRQLAAIMFTDIVGYTALMGKDERLAFELLQKNRDIHNPIIEEFHGILVKEIGDGILASFHTVSDAVLASIKIQELCNKQNLFQLRIGIHLGEVVLENNDVFGDGVNIASRIQSVSIPGSIYISEAVYHNISNKNEIKTRFVKVEKLKNVKQPVKIYEVLTTWSKKAITGNGIKIPSRKVLYVALGLLVLLLGGYISSRLFQMKHATLDTGLEKSIAILPFMDMSPGKDQAYLGDGLAEEISHSMTVINGLRVIGTTSSSQFKGQNLTARDIGEKLNVGIVLEGSIQKAGDILRITAQLISVKDDSTIWSQQFDKEMKDIFAIQDSIAKNIVEKLRLTLSSDEKPRVKKKPTSEEAYSLYLKGLFTFKEPDWDKSVEYNLQAIAKDSQFAPAYAYLALAKTWQISRDHLFYDLPAIREAKDYAYKAIRLDSTLAEGYSALALIGWAVELDFKQAKINFDKSIQLNPGESLIKNRYGFFMVWMGAFDKALQLSKDAINSDPADYNGYVIAATALIYKKKFREAKLYITEGIKLFPTKRNFKNLLYLYYLNAEKYDDLIKMSVTDTASQNSVDKLGFLCAATFKKGQSDESRMLLNKLKTLPANPNNSSNYWQARIYSLYMLKDSIFSCLNRSLANREVEFKLLKIDPFFISLREDPRYKDLYHRYGFDRY